MTTTQRFAPGTFTPHPGPGPLGRMVWAQARTEFVLTLRNSEQLLLTMIIPLGLLIGMSSMDILDLDEPRVDQATPRVLALAVMSTAFTGQAIALGFDRRYGVLKRLAATALPRWSLVAGRMIAVLGVVAVQVVVLGAVAFAMSWEPEASGVAPAVLLLLAGTAAFGALGALLGGALRAEAVLAIANTVWLLLLIAGGIVLSSDKLPSGISGVVEALPSGALAEGLQDALGDGSWPWTHLGVLMLWAIGASVCAARTLRLS